MLPAGSGIVPPSSSYFVPSGESSARASGPASGAMPAACLHALAVMDEKLKLNVNVVNSLHTRLHRDAGGFMNDLEYARVEDARCQLDKMDKVLEILRGKSVQEFEIFLRILYRAGKGLWADQLKQQVEAFTATGTVPAGSASATPPGEALDEGHAAVHRMAARLCEELRIKEIELEQSRQEVNQLRRDLIDVQAQARRDRQLADSLQRLRENNAACVRTIVDQRHLLASQNQALAQRDQRIAQLEQQLQAARALQSSEAGSLAVSSGPLVTAGEAVAESAPLQAVRVLLLPDSASGPQVPVSRLLRCLLAQEASWLETNGELSERILAVLERLKDSGILSAVAYANIRDESGSVDRIRHLVQAIRGPMLSGEDQETQRANTRVFIELLTALWRAGCREAFGQLAAGLAELCRTGLRSAS